MVGFDREFVRKIPSLVKDPEIMKQIQSVNNADLLPHLFRVKGEPFSLKDRPQFDVLFEKTLYPDTIVMSGRQLGKCERCTKKDDDLALRDMFGRRLDTTFDNPEINYVASELDSTSHVGRVSGYTSPGLKHILEIKTSLGRTLHVSEEHGIRTFDGYKKAGDLSVGSRVMTLRKCYSFGIRKESEYRVALTAYLIGDGCCGLGRDTVEITGVGEVVDHVKSLCSEEELRVRPYQGKAHVFHLAFRKCAAIRKFIEEDGIYGKYSYEKSIPDWVFDLDREGARLFVECLWATDGSVKRDKRGFACIDYCSTSRLLASDVRALLSKFGIATHMRVKKCGYRGKDGVYHRCRDAFIIRVYGYQSQKMFLETFDVPGKPSFKIHSSDCGQDNRSNRDTLPAEGNRLIERLAGYLDDPRRPGKMLRGMSLNFFSENVVGELRRKPKYRLSRFKLSKYLSAFKDMGLGDKPEYKQLEDFANGDVIYDKVVSIRNIGLHPTFDIEVGEYHNFISDNICVHNSMTLSRSETFNPLAIPQFQLLYVAPLQEQTRRYSDLYLTEAIRSCPLAQKLQSKSMEDVLSDAKIIKATFHQTFANGSGIQLTYAQTSADRARGIMADMIDFDEIQDQTDETVPIISESLTSSKFGCRRFTGTAKVTENYIETLWQKSSMNEWVMKCEHCGTWAIPTLDHGVLKMIGSDGLHCLHCGKRINVRNGKWISAYPKRMYSFRGYHIPQVVCPAIVDDVNNWQKLLRKLTTGTLATFIQENLGISYSVGQRLLTRQHIQRQCVLPSRKRLQEEIKNNPGRYSFVVAGIDWGGAELSSFTVITVIGIRPNGRIDTLWARRYRGYDPDEQMTDIAKICRFYNVVACLDENSLVLTKTPLTSPCYKRIIDVETTDWVWDGVEWVQHAGVKLMKYVRKDELYGIGSASLTGDHKIYVNDRESRRIDSIQEEERASAMAWRRSSSPISAWYNVWIITTALGRACARLFCSAFRKAKRKKEV